MKNKTLIILALISSTASIHSYSALAKLKPYALGLLLYSPFWTNQSINHRKAKDKKDIEGIKTANKLLARSVVTPLTITAPTQQLQKALSPRAHSRKCSRFCRWGISS